MRKHDNVVLEERTQNIPIEVNVNDVNKKISAQKVKGKTGKNKIMGREDHDVKTQQEIRHGYIKRGKDVSKLRTHYERMNKNKNKKSDFSMLK